METDIEDPPIKVVETKPRTGPGFIATTLIVAAAWVFIYVVLLAD